MKLILLLIFVFIFFLSTYSYSQGWNYIGNFPNDNFKGGGGLQGLAVDPEGKIWVTKYTAEYYKPSGSNDSLFVRLIYVFNPDGSQAEFSPIYKIQVNGITDTLYSIGSRGLRTDQNGNIIYVCQLSSPVEKYMYRINFMDGTGMNKVDLNNLISPPTAPAISENGNIFVAPVVMSDASVLEFTSNFNFLNTHLNFTEIGFSRSIECSDDGLILYIPNYISRVIMVYQRIDETSPFTYIGTIMDGVACESITFNRETGKLWIAGGSYNDLPSPPWSPNTWYEYDIAAGLVLDSINWQMNFPANYNERPRAIDFSPNNKFAYVGCFGSNDYPIVQKFEREIVPVELTSFTVTAIGKEVRIKWYTSTELNNLGFEIQRKLDKDDWRTIGFISGKGTTTETHEYIYIDKDLPDGKYHYRLKQVDFDGSFNYSEIIVAEINNPGNFSLSQNYPNPFNPTTIISYKIPEQGYVSLKVYDVLGNEVALIINDEKPAGSYDVNFDASGLSSGVYFYKLQSGNFVETKKMILLR